VSHFIFLSLLSQVPAAQPSGQQALVEDRP
jgi:hypothetical protein